MNQPAACISVDLDTLHHYRAIHGLSSQGDASDQRAPDLTYAIGVARALELFDEFNIASTLFVIGRDVEVPEHLELLRVAHEQGHELANHTYEHRYDLRHQPAHIRDVDIARGEQAIERVAGLRPVGFRAPGYNIDEGLMETLARRRYLYDSSIFACPPYYMAKASIMGVMQLLGKPSRSSMTLPSTLLAPINPYRPRRGRLWRHDPKSDRPIELPMCVIPGLRLPIIGTSLHLLGHRGFELVYPLLRATYKRCLQLEFHAIDFMDAQDIQDEALIKRQPDLRVPWSQKRHLYGHVFSRLSEDYTFKTMTSVARAL